MANSWLRLWHDMPNDPKWRTIARVSKQPISSVLAVYIHLLVIASNATERGRTQNACTEDLASALDLDVEQIEEIMSAMQGRVLDGDILSGWAKRQVEREDGSAERAKRWREAQKEAKQTQLNEAERNRTPDKDKDKDKEVNPLSDKSDGVRLANGKQKFKDDAIQVLEFLNLKTGKHYRPLKANLDLIAARLAEGAQVSDCRAVIARQSRKWMGTDSEIYLRPATLFNATKFAQYTGEIGND